MRQKKCQGCFIRKAAFFVLPENLKNFKSLTTNATNKLTKLTIVEEISVLLV